MDPTSIPTGPHNPSPATRPKSKRAAQGGNKTGAMSNSRTGANPSSARSVGKAKVNRRSTPAPEEEAAPGASDDERAVTKRRRVEGGEWRELARAVLRFAEVYERVESSRQAWMVELEKERMEIAREVEYERMNLLVDAQVEIARRAATWRRRGAARVLSPR